MTIDLPDSQTIENRRATVGARHDRRHVRPGAGESPYWAGRPYFTSYYPQASPNGLGENPPTADPIFLGPGGAAAGRITTYTVDVPVLPGRVRLDDATDAAAADPPARHQERHLPAHHLLPAAGRAGSRGRRPRAGTDRRAARRHPARAAELVDAVPRRRVSDRGAVARAGAGEAARPHRAADATVRAGRDLPAAAGGRAAGHRRRLPGRPRRRAARVRPRHRGAAHLVGPPHRPRRRRRRNRHRRAVLPPGLPTARCRSCCAGSRRAGPVAGRASSRAWSSCWRSPASCSW